MPWTEAQAGTATGIDLDIQGLLRMGESVSLADPAVLASPVQMSGINMNLPGFLGKKAGKRTTLHGAVNQLYTLSDSELSVLQMQLVKAGLISEELFVQGKISIGDVDEPTRQAWISAISLHMQDKRKSVNQHIAERIQTNAPRWQRLEGMMAGGEDADDVIEVSNPADVRAKVDDAARRLLGRKATAEEKATLTALIQGGQIAEGEARATVNKGNRAREAGGGMGLVDDDTGPKIAGEMAGRFGLRVSSTVRDAGKNAAVGGAKHSDHLPGGDFAADFAGKKEQMDAFALWARANSGPGKLFKKIFYGDSKHTDHVHVTYNGTNAGLPVGGGVGGGELDRFMSSTRTQESGGRYDWNLRSKSGARGAYQFMPGTWKSAAQLAGVDPSDHSPQAQDAAARALMSKYFNELGDWKLVAVAWHAGLGTAKKVKARGGNAGTNDGLISTDSYADAVVARMGSVPSGGPASTMEGVQVIQGAGGEASIDEELRRRNPVEAAGHDVAGTFGNFLKILSGPMS